MWLISNLSASKKKDIDCSVIQRKITDRRKLSLLLLDDLLALLHKPKVAIVEAVESATDNAYLALSDVSTILAARGGASRRAACKLAGQKVLYYASNLDTFDRERLQVEVSKRRRYVESEEAEDSQFERDVVDRKNIAADRLDKTETVRPRIEEIG